MQILDAELDERVERLVREAAKVGDDGRLGWSSCRSRGGRVEPDRADADDVELADQRAIDAARRTESDASTVGMAASMTASMDA